MDVTRRKMVEAELDRLIAKHHDRRVAGKGARPALEAWMEESERRHDARRREESPRVWREYHLAAARWYSRHTTLLVFLIEHHEREAEKRYLSAEGAA